MSNLALQEVILLFLFLLLCVPGILFLITLQNTLKTVEPENRTMKPQNVWLLFIPLFNFVWMFFVIKAVYNSLQNQLMKYGVYETSTKSVYQIGIALCIVSVIYAIPSFRAMLVVPFLTLWVLYWVKVNGEKKKLQLLQNTIGNADANSIFVE